MLTPSSSQIAAARVVTAWYMRLYHDTDDDPGVARMFCDPARVGPFAVEAEALRAGESKALFRVFVATAMFQRRQDVQIMRILRGMSAADTRDLTDMEQLLSAASECGCPNAVGTAPLKDRCDLTKDAMTQRGACAEAPGIACGPKRHTVLLKRYGHFGKVPTSLAWAVREAGAVDLAELYARVVDQAATPALASAALEGALTRAWRVSDKIAAMFLSMLSNPDLSPDLAPWTTGLDWRRWVVIDSNVDLFLAQIGYSGPRSYEARREFLFGLAAGIDLSALKPGLTPENPRVIQQAAYLFMSATNRRTLARDCSKLPGACDGCLTVLRELCPLRVPARSG